MNNFIQSQRRTFVLPTLVLKVCVCGWNPKVWLFNSLRERIPFSCSWMNQKTKTASALKGWQLSSSHFLWCCLLYLSRSFYVFSLVRWSPKVWPFNSVRKRKPFRALEWTRRWKRLLLSKADSYQAVLSWCLFCRYRCFYLSSPWTKF